MVKALYITGLFLIFITFDLKSQGDDSSSMKKNDLKFSGQFSAWAHINPENPYPLYLGGRYIPQLNYSIPLQKKRLIDFEASANIYGNLGIHFFDSASTAGNINPYRVWGRYSSKQFEFRLGLQKIDFGTATMLRALRWFDQVDPRDPLQLTEGVWGGLARYYFLNNTNVWIWILLGNENPKGMEIINTNTDFPEMGGRIQTAIPRGEAGISYHHRVADSQELSDLVTEYNEIPENRIGIDAKWDLVTGLWVEGAWVNKRKDMGIFTNQEIITGGVDYTFGIGSGLTMTLEHMLIAYDENAFQFSQTTNFTALSVVYPIGMFDNVNLIFYYDWTHGSIYNFINWYRQFDKYTLYIMGYWNPENNQLPAMEPEENLYEGVGIQLMFVLNH